MRGRAAADGLLDDLEALLDGEMAMASELSELRQALQHKLGLDIGGTLAKIVFAIDPAAAGERTAVREIVTWNDVTTNQRKTTRKSAIV